MEERKGDLGGKKVIGMPWVRMDVERKIAQHHFWLEKWLLRPSGQYCRTGGLKRVSKCIELVRVH